jgi:hypothetical protein
MNEACAAFGLEQLKRLPESLKKRKDNWNSLYSFFRKYDAYFYLPDLIDQASTNWLAFPLTIRSNAPFSRYDLLKQLELDGIQTRVLFSGNITRHPIGIKLPSTVVLTVKETIPGVKGDTATGGNKPALLDSGISVNVPLFVNEGDKVKINTETGEYMSRAE